jgi:DMSO reductase family type II enzyme heme b subunit
MKALIIGMLTIFYVAIAGFGIAAAGTEPTVTSAPLTSAPTLDGNADDWQNVAVVQVEIKPTTDGDAKNYTGTIKMDVRSGTFGDKIYFFIEWPDDTRDATHKTLNWSAEKDGYVEGKDREDRLAVKFDMGGDFYSCMLSGTEYKADMWHWKAYRSQTAGFVHDKSHVYSFKKMPKAKKHKARNGKEIWIARPGDKGAKLYKSQRPLDNIGDSVPKYIVNPKATGSVADIQSAAKWANGKWYVEMTRKLNTGHDDDVSFSKGQSYKAAMAVFNHTGNDHHSASPFQLDITN